MLNGNEETYHNLYHREYNSQSLSEKFTSGVITAPKIFPLCICLRTNIFVTAQGGGD